MEAADPEAKRRKLDEAAAETTEEHAKEEENIEREADAPADSRARLLPKQEAVGFRLRDCTLNVVPMRDGHVLTPLTGGGLQYFIGGARASAGVSKGRYCFEVKIVAMLNPAEHAQALRGTAPQPKQMLKIGFATQGSPLFLGETSDSVCFDSDGGFTSETKKEATGSRIARDQTMALVLNLDPSSPNKNTVSLFKDGQRCSQPQPLPECLLGKPLFPVVNFRNMTVQVHFGPTQMVPLPFVCRGVQDLAKADGVLAPPDTKKDGKYEVLLPVGLPDEGTFVWLDDFLAKHPEFTELSDRAILKWAESSGMSRSPGSPWKHSNDKPDVKFNIPMMDDWSIRKVLSAIVASQPRNYVVMEVKANFLPAERAELLKRFSLPCYKKVAQVTIGDPPAELTKKAQEEVLRQKQEVAEKEWVKRKAEKARKKMAEAKLKELREAKERAKAAREAKLAEARAAKEAKDAAKEGKEDEPMADAAGEAKEEEKPAAKEEEKEEEKKAVEEEEEEPRPQATLTDEEKAAKFPKSVAPDIASWVLASHFAKFSLPQASEGFDEIRFSWTKGKACEAYFKEWVLRQKVLNRIEDLQPGEWFKAKVLEWQKAYADWEKKQADWKDPVKQGARHAAKELAKKEAAKKAAKEAAEEAKKNEAAEEGKPKEGEGEEKKEGADAEKKAEEKPKEEKPKEEKPKEEKPKEAPADDAEPPDALTVDDILNIGDGEPLFAKFAMEDWALLSLRFELFLLVHSYTKDAQDPERVGIHESNLAFYYNKYFKKNFTVKFYGVESISAVVDMVEDAATIAQDSSVLETSLAEDTAFDQFVRLTEEQRRVRQKAIDDGDAGAKLKFTPAPEPVQEQPSYGAHRGRYGTSGLGSASKSSVPPPPPPRWKSGPYGGGGGYGGKGSVIGPPPGRGGRRNWP